MTVRGGLWAARARGVSADCVTAQCAKGSLAATFCAKYHVYRHQSYSIARYTDVGAARLAEAWSRNMHWMFNVWLAQEDSDYSFTERDLAGYMEELGFTVWFEGFPVGSAALERALGFRRIRPQR